MTNLMRVVNIMLQAFLAALSLQQAGVACPPWS
jgi:hypothetical protein